MKFGSILTGLLASSAVYAHGTDSHGSKTDKEKLDLEYSLPELVKLNDKLPAHWRTSDATKLEAGRFILTPTKNSKGSLWLKKSFNLETSFTIEWTFRDVGFEGDSKAAMAFWFVTGSSEQEIDETLKDKSMVNGPSKFDGLMLHLDTNEVHGPSIRAQLNDKITAFTPEIVHENSFGSCLLAYQDSAVPTTARLTYDKDNKSMLKLQIDNRVCFQTFKVKLPQGLYRFGVTAVNDNNAESFEILKMHAYNGVVEDSLIPNSNPMPQPKFVTKQIDKDTGKEKIVEQDIFDTKKGNSISTLDLYKKLDSVEGRLLANDISVLDKKLDELIGLEKEATDFILQMVGLLDIIVKKRSEVFNQSDENKEQADAIEKEKFKDFLSLNDKLESLYEEQIRIREATQKANSSKQDVDTLLWKISLWIFPLIVIMLIMTYYTFKIRQEIIKTKLL